MTLSVYVAASSAEIDRARDVMRRLRDDGIEVTSTWPEVVAAVGDANPRAATAQDRHRWASADLAQVDAADVLWLLAPSSPSFGAGVEFGYARARGLIMIASGDTLASIFTAYATEFYSDDDAFTFLQHLAARRK